MKTLKTATVLAKSRRGATAVEVAFVAPIALTLIFGILQVGYLFMVQAMMQDAARKGCRIAACPSSTNATVSATVNSVLSSMNLTGMTTTIQVNGVTTDVSSANYGDQISVQLSIPTSKLMLFSVSFANFTGSITGADTLRCL